MAKTARRADQALVERGLFESRNKARAAIEAGRVTADGVVVMKAATAVAANAVLSASPAHPYVSRGGVKLAAALSSFAFDARGKVCIDVGASTGGFTDVLLRAGARRIYAVDVGRGQLHRSLHRDARVIALEKTDIRKFDRTLLSERVDLVAIDVSFISLRLVLPAVTALAASGTELVALLKPQFEVGRKYLRKGIVRDPARHRPVCEDLIAFASTLGWKVIGVMESPLLGVDGNREFLVGANLARR
jgi:23S rRNA (cytidine1920-2'-O)/16S rRNA (cytidine1409-2'-O)-methyltransferase